MNDNANNPEGEAASRNDSKKEPGRYRIKRGAQKNPFDGVHPEMLSSSNQAKPQGLFSQPTPLYPSELIGRQEQNGENKSTSPETEETENKASEIWNIMLQRELKISEMHELSMVIIGILRTLHEKSLDEIFARSNSDSKNTAAWSRDLEKIKIAESLLENIQLN